MGISGARDAARAMHHRVKHEGADPIAEKRHNVATGKAAQAGVGTLKALLDTYGRARGSEVKSWKASRPRVELIFKPLLDRPLATITLADLQLQADDYQFPKSDAFGVRTLRPVLKWASRRHALMCIPTREVA
jgi:hypothetical protein